MTDLKCNHCKAGIQPGCETTIERFGVVQAVLCDNCFGNSEIFGGKVEISGMSSEPPKMGRP
jgi:hypothetical protein